MIYLLFVKRRRDHAWPHFTGLLLLLIWSTLSAAPTTRPADVDFTSDVIYGKAGDEDLMLDISRPKDANQPLPCVLVIHGGGWSGGDKRQNADVTNFLARHGFVSATVNYRLAPAHPFPAQVQDVKCAVRFLRAHAAEYHLDPGHIGAMGFSAGGHLAMMLGLTTPADKLEGGGGNPEQSSRVQAVVSFFGPTDLAAADIPASGSKIVQSLIGGTPGEKPDAYRDASPISYVAKNAEGAPPILLFQGSKDPLVPITQAYRMVDEMTKAGIPGRLEVLVGAGHGWGGEDIVRTGEEAVAFLNKKLRTQHAED